MKAMEQEYSHNSAWSVGWGWLVAVPAVIILSWAASRRLNGAFFRTHPAEPADPFEILKLRYAKGEIDKAEFEEKWAAIQ
jgi:putative membrane protein